MPPARDLVKQTLGRAVSAANPQCRYDRAIVVLAHMRCGSTALSNILCSRPDISGYGETHVRHTGPASLGQLVVNQALRGAWSPRARHLFDKILHDRLDAAAPPAFFAARAIFLAREPGPAIRSIRHLYDKLGRDEYGTDAATADYYIERLRSLRAAWARFPADRRVASTHSRLIAAPETELARISARLGIAPALANRYVSPAASKRGGGGDPLASGRHSSIQQGDPDPARAEADLAALAVTDATRQALRESYADFLRLDESRQAAE